MYTGERVAERFTVIRLAGHGGMSEVYLARDQQTNQDVAIKVFSGGAAQEHRRFLLEAAALSSLPHPAIVRYMSQGETSDGRPFLVLEWLEGEELTARLARGGLSIEECVGLLRRLAGALAVAHEKGIVHRDLKPQNLFLPNRSLDELKLIDFGIARLQDTTRGLTHTGTIIGTPGYMSPEQASGGTIELGPASDIFSLGCVAFECLTGRQAFEGETVIAVLAKILFTEVPEVRALRSETPEALSALIAGMLHKDPSQRPRDGAALSALLEELKTPTEAAAPPPIRYETLTASEQRLFCVLMIRASLSESALAASPAAPTEGDALDDAPRGEWLAVRRDAAAIPAESLVTLRAVVVRYGGRVEALSDGALVVVISGAGVASDQAIKAVRCALSLQSLLPGAQMALAIDRSEAGRLGAAIDEAASLLPAADQEIGLWLDEGVAGLVDGRFTIERRGPRFLLQSQEERGLSTRLEQGRTLLGRPSLYLGRERELSWLAELFDHCTKTSSARCALVTAPAGMGKSRLAREACRALAPQSGLEVWCAYGDPLRAGAPFGLLSEMLRRVFSLQDGEPLSLRQQKLAQRVSRSLSQAKRRRAESLKRATKLTTTPAEDAQRITEFLGEIAGVPFSDKDSAFLRAARQDARLMNDQLQAAFLDWLFAELQQRPLLLLLDDLHWGDLPSINFLDAALRELKSCPLMLLALSRPEVKETFPALWQRRNIEEMSLSPLSARMSERIARGVLGHEASDTLIERLVEHAAGNAFYLEELLRSAAEGRAEVLPETVLAMSQARLEALPRDTRRVLRAASVFGQRCWQGALAMLLGEALNATELSLCLQELCQQEVLFADGEGAFPAEEEFSFRHTLQREAAYAMLTDEDKRRGHVLAGEWLSQAGEPNAAVLAEHFERGGAAPRAVECYLRAAEQALAGDDLAAALSRAERGIALGPSDEQRGALRILQIEPHLWRNDHAAAEACALEAMEALPKNSTLWYKAAAAILKVSTHLGHFEHFVALIEALREQAPSPEARGAYVTDTSMMVPYLSFAGMYDVAELFVQKVEAASLDLADHEPIVRGWLYMAKSYRSTLLKGDPWGFLCQAREAAQSFLQAGDLRTAQLGLLNGAVAAKFLGSLVESAYLLRRVIADGERLGLPLMSISATHYLAVVLATSQEDNEELAALQKEIEAFVANNHNPLAGTSRHSLAQVYLLQGELEAAAREAQSAVELLLVAPPAHAHALATLSMILLRQGKTQEAMSAAKEALDGLLTLGAIGEGEGQVLLAYIEAYQAGGAHREARATLSLAKKRLLKRADKIEELRYRDLFLLVPENQRILQLSSEAQST